MTEYRIVSFTWPTETILAAEPGSVKVNTIDFTQSVPQLAEHMDGWEVMNSQVIPNGDRVHVIYFLRTSVEPPTLD